MTPFRPDLATLLSSDDPRVWLVRSMSVAQLVAVVASTLVLAPTLPWPLIGVGVAVGLSTTVAVIASFDGRRVLAGWILVSCGVLGCQLAIALGGGIAAPAIASFALPGLIATVALGARSGALVACVSAATLVGWAMVAPQGAAPPPDGLRSLVVVNLVTTLFVALIAGLGDRLTRSALDEARLGAARAGHALAEAGREIDRRVAVERRLEQALADVNDASETKSRFLTNMSHELRTPLDAILGYAEIALEDSRPEDETLREDLRRIQSSGRHLLRLVSDVLDLSRVEAGRLPLDAETVDPRVTIAEAVATAQPTLQKNGDTVNVVIAPDAPVAITDPLRLQQIVMNLVSNAARFTRGGEVTVEAAPDTIDGTPALRISVRDTGVGIAPDVLAELFQPFVQSEAAAHRRYGGSGLGLALSARLAEMLGGRIDAHSVPGEGSVFSVVVPTQAVSTRLRERLRRRIAEASAATTPVVVCVDRHHVSLDHLDRSLTAAKLHVVAVDDPSAVLELARRLRPAAVTFDLRMAEAWATAKALHADTALHRIQAVMVASPGSPPSDGEHEDAAGVVVRARGDDASPVVDAVLRALGLPIIAPRRRS